MSDIALFFAALRGDYPRVRYLIEHDKVDPNGINSTDGSTTLHRACSSGHATIVEYLLRHCHVHVEMSDAHGERALHKACYWGHATIVHCLIERGHAQVEARDERHRTALHWACWRGKVDTVQYLVEHANANVHAEDNHQETPLHVACGATGTSSANVISYLLPRSRIDAKVMEIVWKKKMPWDTIKRPVLQHYAARELGLADGSLDEIPMHVVCNCPLPNEQALLECLNQFPQSVLSTVDRQERLPLHLALEAGASMQQQRQEQRQLLPPIGPTFLFQLLEREPRASVVKDPVTGFYPYEAAATCCAGAVLFERESSEARSRNPRQTSSSSSWLDIVYTLLRFHDPEKLLKSRCVTMVS